MKNASIILAGGQSKRLGYPKQLVKLGGKTLVEIAVENSRQAGISEIVVVTGARAKHVCEAIRSLKCRIEHNANWKTGMGSSIQCGAESLLRDRERAESVLLQLCDQPLIPFNHLGNLLKLSRNNDQVIATVYDDGSLGVPACFPGRFLPELRAISPERGAKRLIKDQSAIGVECPEAMLDIDRPIDVAWLMQH